MLTIEPLTLEDALAAEGTALWVNVRALRACLDGKREFPFAYVDRQAIDDVRVLVAADKRTKSGSIINALQAKLRAKNQECHTLRRLYCAAAATQEESHP